MKSNILPFKINGHSIPHDGIDYQLIRYQKALKDTNVTYIAIDPCLNVYVSAYPLIYDGDKEFWYTYFPSDFDFLSERRDPFIGLTDALLTWDYPEEWATTLTIFPTDKLLEWIEDNI